MTRPSITVRGQRGMGGHSRGYEGASVEYTLPGIFNALALRFDLDPCAPPGGLPWIPAARFYSAADDGLAQAECAEAVVAARLGMTFAVRGEPLLGQAALWEAAA